jgi:hypothetical protein
MADFFTERRSSRFASHEDVFPCGTQEVGNERNIR